MNFAKEIADVRPKPGELAVFWLGQAGFLLKDNRGRLLAIDPYLTDCGERIRGFKRMTPKLLSPDELNPDVCIVTHPHFDHYDYDAIPVIAANGKTFFLGPQSCIDLLRKESISENRIGLLSCGSTVERGGIRITATWADHGEQAPDAIGTIVKMGGYTVYFSGDTAFHPEYIPTLAAMKPDVAVLSINGAFGNLNAEEGAKLAKALGVKIAIPCHFWTFLEHGGSPLSFKELLESESGCKPCLMCQGEMLMLKAKS